MSETAFALPASDGEPTTLPGGERLQAIIAAAASFDDRADADFFAPLPDADGDLRQRVARWLGEAAADPATARRVVTRRAATGRELGAGLRNVELRDPHRLPEWAEALVVFLAAQPATAADDPASGRAGGIFDAFRRGADALIEWKDGALEGVEVTDAAHEDVVRAFGVRVWYACEPAIEFELRLHDEPSDEPAAAALDVSLEGWLARLETLPGLAYVIGTSCCQWRQSVTEIFARLRADLPLLRQRLWDGSHAGAVTSYTGDAGDRHDDGRAVALLEFESGRGVVYKPKDLRHTLAFMHVVAFLNERGLPLDLPVREILPRDGYGWEERAIAVPCAGRDGFARYYRRLGMLARLVQLLEGRDLWADNLLAVGEHPVLTDLECLLYPRVTPPPTLRGVRRELLEVFEETVVRTGIVVQPWVPRPSIPIRDLGCLSRAGDESLPLPPYRPWCGDEVADPWAFGDEVVAGYRDMQAALAANREELRAADGPLALFEQAQVRYIWRHTWDCQNILRASASPRALRSGFDREIVLARVLRDAYGMLHGHEDRVDLPEIAEAELKAFRQLDVPLFLAQTTSRSPVTQDGREIGDHFRGTAWERLQARIDGLDEFPLDEHVAVVTACLEGALNAAEIAAPASAPARPDAALSEQRLLELACGVADAILDARVSVGEGGGWLGLSWYPVPDLYQVEVAGGDLLTGTSAIGIFLAELAARIGTPRYWAAAYDVLEDLAELVGGSPLFLTELRLAGGAPVPGGFAGPGATIYALARSATLLGDPTLLAAARGLTEHAAAAARSGKACADVPFGSAGLLLDLLRLRADGGGEAELDAIVRDLAADALAALAEPAPRFAPYSPTSRIADFVPVGRDSVALALARTLADAPELVADPGAVRSALAAHRYDPLTRGGRLAALDAATALGTTVDPAMAGGVSTGALCCRGLVAGAGEALVAGDRATADRLARELVDRRDRTGRWFSDRWVDDRLNLSAVDGVVAVGLLALGLLDPELPPLTLLR